MPLYEYQCDTCDHRFEVIRKFSDPPIDTCPKCGGPVHKLISAPAFQLKGTGWYATDFAGKGKASAPASKSEGSGDSSKDGSKDGSKESSKDGSGESSSKDSSSKESSKEVSSASAKESAPAKSESTGSASSPKT